MRALRVEAEAGPESLVLTDVPEPDDSGLVVAVRAAGVGFPDLLMNRGEFQIRQPLPFTLGWEAAGQVVSAPEGSTFAPGDRVVTLLSFGTHAERVAAVPEATFPLPDSFTFEQGAAYPLNYLTAYAALHQRAALKKGETVLVHGAGGGVGTAAIQVAKALGATVFAVVSSDEKADAASAAGADSVFKAGEDWRNAAVEASGGGVDVIFDPVGGVRFNDSLRSLAPEGRLMVVGFAAGEIPTVTVNRLLFNNTDVRGCTWSILANLPEGLAGAASRLNEMADRGALRPPVVRAVPLEHGPAVLKAIAERRAVARTVVLPDGNTAEASSVP
ncbi:MAG: NADPH:quinone reductase [Actinomycetota bacterium]|jgi:NADPH2:quinone reductase|nr:NADPH:quinone reductase [Actinomycetota bacterium]